MSLGLGILLAAAVVMLGVVLIVAIVQTGDTQRATATARKDQDHRLLAEAVAEAQKRTAEELATIQTRLAAIEKLLRDVD